ncbi:MAG: TatD family hydrolase [Bacteroidota bacterium]
MELIDTHAHVYASEFTPDITQVIARSLDNGVRKMYMPNIDVATIDPMLALEQRYPDQCIAMMGIHPCYVKHDFQQQLYQAEAWLSKRAFAAIGEIGMDLYHDRSYQAQQEEALMIQLTWAKQHQLPVAIHCRASWEPTLTAIEKQQDGNLRGIFHCFGGSIQEAERAIALGFYLGIGGIVTFRNASLATTVANVSLDHLVLETDAPYLAPMPYRGQRNEPAHILHIARKVAELQGTDLATVAHVTTVNAQKVFEEHTPSHRLSAAKK